MSLIFNLSTTTKNHNFQAYFDSVDEEEVENPNGASSSGKGIVEQLFSHFGGGAFR